MNWVEFRSKAMWRHVVVIGKHCVEFFGQNDEEYTEEHKLFEITEDGYKNLNINALKEESQKEIKEFLNQKPKDWFSGVTIKNKYNVIIGNAPNVDNSYVMYAKTNLGFMPVTDCSIKTDVFDSRFQFTPKEIKQLKAEMPIKSLAKVIGSAMVKVDITNYESWVKEIE